MSFNSTSDEFIQKILDISRTKEIDLKNGKVRLILTPYDVSYLQNIIEKGVGSNRISFILTPNDVESIKNLFRSLISFKVKSRPNSSCGTINFKYFMSLQHLQLDKIRPLQFKNLEIVRAQLKSLTCYQSLKFLKDLLRGPGHNIEGSFWSNLRYLDISFNGLEYFDDSLCLLSTLDVFNASHNHVKSSEGLKLLKEVYHLNLGYNKLFDFPSFSAQACMSLRQLILRFNFLESLTGIQYLVHLSELDLGCNLLQSHDCLVPLKELNNLTIVELTGNPLAFHNKHRILTCAHLNAFILKRVVLDGCRLNSKEIKESHLIQIKVSHCPIRNSSSNSLQTISGSLYQTNMIGSLNYSEDASHDSDNSNESSSEPIAKAYKRKIRKQKVAATKNLQKETPPQEESIIETSSDKESHVKTKEFIQEKRKELGAGWLLSASSYLGSYTEQTISGSLKSQISETESTKFLSNENSEKDLTSCESPDNVQIPSSATESVSENVPETSVKELISDDGIFNSSSNKNNLVSLTSIDDESEKDESSESADETEVEANLFIVQNIEDGIETQLILSVGVESMSEKDGLSGKHLHSWSLKSLISAQEIIEDEHIFIQLEFDTMRKEKRERNYLVDDTEASQQLLTLLEKHVEARNLQAISDGLTQCLKCNFEFQNDNADRTVIEKDLQLKEVNMCPKCGSTLLVNVQSEVIPVIKPMEVIETQPSSYTSSLKIHDFLQSINSSKSLEDSGSMNRSPSSRPRSISSEMQLHRKAVSLSPGHLDEKSQSPMQSCSSSSVDCISLNTEENVPVNCNKTFFDRESVFRSESDITVLSNPSQSSIAVISTTSSSIEQINPVGGLEAIPEQDLPPNEYPSQSIYDLSSTNDTFYSANFNSPVAKIKESSKNDQGLTSSGEVSWNDSASTETFIQISQDTLKRTRTPDIPESKRVSEAIDESIEVEDESGAIWEELQEPCDWPSDIFTQLDHRIRLHLEVDIFSDDEELFATLKGSISTISSNYFGMVVFSSKKIYFFKLLSGEMAQLSNSSSLDISALKAVHTLLGSQGIMLIFENLSLVISLGYADLCNSFITFIEDIFKTKLKLQNVVFQHSTEQDLTNVKNEVLMSDLISHVTENTDVNVELFLMMTHIGGKLNNNVALILTENSINLAEVQYFSPSGNYEIHFVLFEKQLLSSLMSLHLSEDLRTVGFHFLDEEENSKHYWLLKARSKSSMASLLLILRKHWESLFLIQMQLTVVSKCLACGYDADCGFLNAIM